MDSTTLTREIDHKVPQRATATHSSASEIKVRAKIEEILTARGISLAALARATGIPRESLRRKVRPGGRIMMSDLSRIATALGIAPSELVR
ncbi:helix-turn-helix domain-containing protein [Demequina lutea]|uniref:DNA-binding phage protein n=1 Tax=Demequina lutea TaxID=431489 RepID=A0A7Z0CHW2_9MICO|nr:helix-turn-helix transcriptional regulator [Demequina lutea]NYI41249.1 DNA-binding phage protein [Demequina lutea]